jgi:O-antigen ligase
LRTGRRKNATAAVGVLEPPAESKAPSRLPQRILLVGATALVVARPLVLGEDPGLLDRPMSDPYGLVISLLWLVLAVGWAGWRMASQQSTWHASAVDLGLAAVAGLVFLSSLVAASYKHPAWLIAWEWVVLLIVFCLVRQLGTSTDDRRGLLAALLATGVMLSVLALYQYTVVLPQNRALAGNPAKLHDLLAKKHGIFLTPDDPQEQYWRERLLMDHVFATYGHPNSFAGFLALLLPIAVGWTYVTWKRYSGTWWPIAAAACVLLLAMALWLTHSRGGILAVLLVGAAIGVLRWGRVGLRFRSRVLGVLAGLVVLVAVAAWSLPEGNLVVRLAGESLGKRLEYWGGAWRMISDPAHRDHFWAGVGPGHFGRFYPRYMAPDAVEKVQDPHNFALETWATCGVFALVALLTTLALFFWRTRLAWMAPALERADEPTTMGPPRWEFYVGGMLGLVLAFVLRAVSGLTSDEILVEGALSGALSLLWFAAFALFETIPWTGPTQVLALVAGIVAVLLNLCVSGGIFFPSVAQPLWIVAALALAPGAVAWSSRQWLASAWPLPVVAVACWFYFSTAAYPVLSANNELSRAQVGQEAWFARLERKLGEELSVARTPGAQGRAVQRANSTLEEFVIHPLDAASAADPWDSYPQTQLAYWTGRRWQLFARFSQFESDGQRREVLDKRGELGKAALRFVARAEELDPDGLQAYSVEFQLHTLFAQEPNLTKQVRDERLNKATFSLREMLKRDPQDAQLHFSLASILYSQGDAVEGRTHARQAAQRDDRLSARGFRGLTDAQRKQVSSWLASAPSE